MSDLDTLLQNISDISSESTTTIASVTALISTLIAFGDKAYPYAIKIIDAVIDLYKELDEGYESVISLLEKLKTEIETKLAENGFITFSDLDDLDDFVTKVETMHTAQLAAQTEE